MLFNSMFILHKGELCCKALGLSCFALWASYIALGAIYNAFLEGFLILPRVLSCYMCALMVAWCLDNDKGNVRESQLIHKNIKVQYP